MKKVLLLSLSLVMGLSAFAQQVAVKSLPAPVKATLEKKALGTDVVKGTVNFDTRASSKPVVVNEGVDYMDAETIYTTYDLQSNNFVANRMYQTKDGSVAVVATMSRSEFDEAFLDRGTGYNFARKGKVGKWGGISATRVEAKTEKGAEADMRTGWPTIAPYGAEGEILVNHSEGLNYWIRTKAGQGLWDGPHAIPNPENLDEIVKGKDNALAWPRIVTTGENNEVLHVFAAASGDSGTAQYYLRTADLQNWDIQFSPLAMDSLHINVYAADDYAVSANGENIAVVYCAGFMSHVMCYESNDGGLTWNSRIVWESPIHGLDWKTDENSLFSRLYGPTQASVAIGKDGVTHVALGVGLYDRTELGNSYNLYMGMTSDGVAYWNDTTAWEMGIEESLILTPKDSTEVTVYDTLTVVDTLFVYEYDTTNVVDSTLVYAYDTTDVIDTILVVDSIVVYDTLYVIDSVTSLPTTEIDTIEIDTVEYKYDTVYVVDTYPVVDTILVDTMEVVNVDTILVYDTTFVIDPETSLPTTEIDTIVLDTTYYKYDTTEAYEYDTMFVYEYNTTIVVDSSVVFGYEYDTTCVIDTTTINDSIVYDTTYSIDTTVVYEYAYDSTVKVDTNLVVEYTYDSTVVIDTVPVLSPIRSSQDDSLKHALRLWWPNPEDPDYIVLDATNFCAWMPPHAENGWGEFDYTKQYTGSDAGTAGDYLTLFGVTAYPSIAVDPAGNLAVAYSSPDLNRALWNNAYYMRSIFVNYKPADSAYWWQMSVAYKNLYADFIHSGDEATFISAVSTPVNENEFWFSCLSDDTPGFHTGTVTSQANITTSIVNVFKYNPAATMTDAEEEIGVGETTDVVYNIFPNPASDYICISSSMDANATVTFTNIAGQTVKVVNQNLTTGNNTIAVNDLTSGIYFCTVTANGFSHTSKVVVK